MVLPHPHTDATYRIIRRPDMSFGAEVSIPGQRLATVTGFATEALAEAWVAKHKREVAEHEPYRGWRGRPKKPQ
jgi:hypothetical protein